MTTTIRLSLALTLLLLVSGVLPTAAPAGILDSPPPTLGGQKSVVSFMASGVMNAAGLGTFFSCTNPLPDPVVMSVELFTDSGGDPCNDADAARVTVQPGGTVMFSTQNNVESSFFSTQPLTAVDMFLSLGSARIVTTGKGPLCTAFVADVYNSPPSSMMPLKLVLKGKQRGD